jgi:hypothetical protein
MAGSNVKLLTSLLKQRTSHLDACIYIWNMPMHLYMEHAHASYAHTHSTSAVTHRLGQVGAKILCSNPTPLIPSLFTRGRTNKRRKLLSKKLHTYTASVALELTLGPVREAVWTFGQWRQPERDRERLLRTVIKNSDEV